MKSINNPFAMARPKRQTHAQPSSKGSELPGVCYDNLSSETMKYFKGTLLILGFLLLIGNSKVFAQFYIRTYTDVALHVPTIVAEKVVEGTGNDTNYYSLSWGQSGNGTSSEIGLTVVTKSKKDGTILWQKKYGVPPMAHGERSVLWGYAITVDSGTNATGNIAIGGYAALDSLSSSQSEEDFVMEIDPTGAVLWFQYWSPVGGFHNGSKGVQDLIFNHETGANSGSITAVSLDVNTTSSVTNMFVTLVNSTSIIKMQRLTDATGNYNFQIPGPGGKHTLPHPRIVESPSLSKYYIVGCRTSNAAPPNHEIGFWKASYGLGAAAEFDDYVGSGTPKAQIYITGAVEDEGHYSPSGNPTVFLSGFYANSTVTLPAPLMVEVTSLNSSPPTFTALNITKPSGLPDSLYTTDIAIVRVKRGSKYQLMSSVNYSVGLGGAINMYILKASMNFTGTPNATMVGFTDSNTTNLRTGEFGGIIHSTKDVHSYFLAGDDFGGSQLYFCRTDDKLDLCEDTANLTTTNPSYTSSFLSLGDSVRVSYPGATAYDSSEMAPGIGYVCGPTNGGPNDAQTVNPGSLFGSETDNTSGSIGQILPKINIYPNPAANQAWIDINAVDQLTVIISIYDVTGKEIISKNADILEGRNHLTLDLSSVPKGLYLIKITNPDKNINTSQRIEKY